MTDNDQPRGLADVIAEALSPSGTDPKGGDRPVGIQACARASITSTDRDDKWAAAVTTWDKLRADIRKLPRDQEITAWELAWQAMTDLRAAFDREFKQAGGH